MPFSNTNRNMFKSISSERRFEIAKEIEKMKSGLDKDVLTLVFIKDMSCPTAAKYAKAHNLCIGKKGKPLSTRRMQQICIKYFPDIYDYAIPKYHNRNAHFEFVKECNIMQCAICGSKDNIEVHHMIPLFLGGTTDKENCIGLCKKCHRAVTNYQFRIFPERIKRKRSAKADSNDDYIQMKF